MSGGLDRRALLRGAGGALVLGAATACTGSSTRTAPVVVGPTGPARPSVSLDEALSDPTAEQADSEHAAFRPKGSRASNKVGIMFHGDGDRATTEQAVRVLRRANVTASIFVVGTWLKEEPTVARLLLDAGHELGNHSYSHPDFRRATPAVMKTEIERCRDILVAQTKSPGMGLLAPEVDLPVPVILKLAASAGYDQVIGWDVDPRDWSDPGPAVIERIVGSGSRPGSIVQLHLGHPETVQALPKVFAALRARGLEPTSVSDVLAG